MKNTVVTQKEIQQENKSLYKTVRAQAARVDQKIGRIVFGDDNPVTRHVRSSIRHRIIRAKSGYNRPPEADCLFDAGELKEKGFVRLENLYSDDLIKTVSEKVAAAYADPSRYIEGPGGYSQMLSQAFVDVPEIKDLLLPSIVEAVENYYRAYLDIGTVVVRRTFSVDDKAPQGVYSSDWHTDHRMPVMLKMFYLVNDTTEQDGPLHIIEREKTNRIMRSEYKGRDNPGPSVEDPATHVKFTGKAGTVIIGNVTYCLHRAGRPEEGRSRDLIQFQLFPSVGPLPENWIEDMDRCRQGLGKKWF